MIINRQDNREHWLQRTTLELRDLFAATDFTLPDTLHMSIGFPAKGALAAKHRRIGECWGGKASADNNHHIFISPLLSDPLEVMATLVHELGHAAVGVQCGHKGDFIKMMKQTGLAGKPTATIAGAELLPKLVDIFETVGRYPHAALNAGALEMKKQTTRMLKASCETPCTVEDKPYTVRLTRMHIEAFGAPVCPNCSQTMAMEEK